MPQILKLPLPIVCTAALLALGVLGCSGSPTEPSGEEHGPEGQGGESGESGTQYAIAETATEVRAGVRLIISYNSTQQVFSGTVENTTNATVAYFAEVDHRFRGCGSRISAKWNARRSVATCVVQFAPIGVATGCRYPTREFV